MRYLMQDSQHQGRPMMNNKLFLILACLIMVGGALVNEDHKRRTKKNNRINYTRIIDNRFN